MILFRPTHRRRFTAGFTLLEMAVVLAILIVLAGLIVARLDVFEMKANKAVAAVSMSDLNQLLQVSRASNSTYPDSWDSLVYDSTGNLWQAGSPAQGFPGLHPELTGGAPFNTASGPVEIVPDALTAGQVQSLGRLFMSTVYDVPVANYPPLASPSSPAGIPGDYDTLSGTGRVLAAGGKVAFLNYAGGNTQGGSKTPGGTPDPSNKSQQILSFIYPQQLAVNGGNLNGIVPPPGKDLIVLGLGPRNTMIGANTTSASFLTDTPFYPNENQNQYYNRYLVVFEVDNTGGRCRQVAVLGSDGDPQRGEIADYNNPTGG